MKYSKSKDGSLTKVISKALIVCTLLVGTLTPTMASAYTGDTAQQLNAKPYVSAQLKTPSKVRKVYLKTASGETKQIDGSCAYQTKIVENRTVLAVRDVTEGLGFGLEWSQADKIATVTKDSTTEYCGIYFCSSILNKKMNIIFCQTYG